MMLKAVLAALALVVTPPADRGTPEQAAQQHVLAASLTAQKLTPDELAFVLAWGQHETHFAVRIHSGNCKRWECDRGRARGPWQLHQNGMRAEDWNRMHGVENTPMQVARAVRQARWALRQCPDDRIRGAFRVLGARGCGLPLKGEAERVATFGRIRSRL